MSVLVFDIDGTLAPVGGPVPGELIEGLKRLEQKGHTIVFSSGKPLYYQCGMVRQLGLRDPVMIGENGAAIQFGVHLPPEKYYHLPYPESVRPALERIKGWLDGRFPGELWYQPNEHALTVFPRSQGYFAPIAEYLSAPEHREAGLRVFEQPDCFDIVPSCINKGEGLLMLCGILGVDPSDTVAVGDSGNDLPMFEAAGFSIAVGGFSPPQADISLSDTMKAVEYLMRRDA